MELLLITSARLKIMMSAADMAEYAIACDHLEYDVDDTGRALRTILDRARDEVGFDAKGNSVLVQMFPSRDGGCEMYVTKPSSAALPALIHSHAPRIAAVFRFQSATLMVSACQKLLPRGDILASEAYAAHQGMDCYLLIYTHESDVFGREPMYLSVANEYGHQMKSDYAVAYVREHCRCICQKDAIPTLATLA